MKSFANVFFYFVMKSTNFTLISVFSLCPDDELNASFAFDFSSVTMEHNEASITKAMMKLNNWLYQFAREKKQTHSQRHEQQFPIISQMNFYVFFFALKMQHQCESLGVVVEWFRVRDFVLTSLLFSVNWESERETHRAKKVLHTRYVRTYRT